MKKLFFYLLAYLLVNAVQAQIKMQGTEFNHFISRFPATPLPFELGRKEIIKKVEHDEYARIEQKYAEKYLNIAYSLVNEEAVDETPRKVAHYVAGFTAYDQWKVVICYWYDSPPSRELHDNFELIVFDKWGGKIASQVIAGIWVQDTQLAYVAQVGKDIIITITQTQNNTQEILKYKLTEKGLLLLMP